MFSASFETYTGRLDGEREVSASLGVQYDLARELSANLGLNYWNTDSLFRRSELLTLETLKGHLAFNTIIESQFPTISQQSIEEI